MLPLARRRITVLVLLLGSVVFIAYTPVEREIQSSLCEETLAGQKKKLSFDDIPQNQSRTSLEHWLGKLNCSDEPSAKTSRALRAFLSEEAIFKRSRSCHDYFKTMSSSLLRRPGPTPLEKEFPLAFAHSVHREIGILELFLASSFRPYDAHCIHIDAKADAEVKRAVYGIVSCYQEHFPSSTIFISTRSIPVYWGHISVLRADLICASELSRANGQWKVFMNPAGTELPLMSIDEMRSWLHQVWESVQGQGDYLANFVDISINTNPERHRKVKVMQRRSGDMFDLKWTQISEHTPPPCELRVLKGSKNVALTRRTIKFILSHPFSVKFYNWLELTQVPDEHFYATLASFERLIFGSNEVLRQHFDHTQVFQNASQQHCYSDINWSKKSCLTAALNCSFGKHKDKPGQSIGDLKSGTSWVNGLCARYTHWVFGNHEKICHGEMIRSICNFAVRDLPEARTHRCLTANKFNLGVSPAAALCQVKHLLG